MSFDKEKQLKILNLFLDFDWRIRNLYYIVNEEGETILFNPNTIQVSILRDRSDFRDIILKYRQGGVSTLFIVLMVDEVLFGGTNINNVFITHRQDLLDVFFQTARFVYNNIPKEYKALLPTPTTDNSNELAFEKMQNGKTLNNRLKISLDVRGRTPTRLHISEFAFMDIEKQIQLKLAIDQFRKTKITIETTANGVGNVFYNSCMMAKNGKGSYKLLFFPWYIEERNVEPIKNIDEFNLDSFEEQLKLSYNLTNEQLAWRRTKIFDANALGKDGYKFFEQENPTTIEGAFISTGSSVFDTTQPFIIKQPIKEIEGWKIYQKAQDQLIFGVDVSEGGTKGDYSTIVCRNIDKEIVAIFKGKVQEEIFAKKLDWFFNYNDLGGNYLGYVLIENNVGLALIKECQKYSWFNERVLMERKNDKITGEENTVFKYGFRTTTKSKDLIIRQYRAHLYNKLEVTSEIYAEILTYVYDNKNSANALSPNHDDLLMADMICLHGLLTEPNLLTYKEEWEFSDEKLEGIRKRDILKIQQSNKEIIETMLDGYIMEEFN